MPKDPSKSKTYRCDVVKILMSNGLTEAVAFDLVYKHKDEVEKGIAMASFPMYVAQKIIDCCPKDPQE